MFRGISSRGIDVCDLVSTMRCRDRNQKTAQHALSLSCHPLLDHYSNVELYESIKIRIKLLGNLLAIFEQSMKISMYQPQKSLDIREILGHFRNPQIGQISLDSLRSLLNVSRVPVIYQECSLWNPRFFTNFHSCHKISNPQLKFKFVTYSTALL